MYNNARGIHFYSQLLKTLMIFTVVLLLRISPSFTPPPVSRKLMYIPLVLTKAETTSDTFLQVFLITIYLIIIENWIVTLLVKITCNFIKKMYNMKLIVTVPYVKIFFNNFLHFSNSCDVKLKSILIDCSVFVSLGSGFMHLPEYFLVVVIIFTWLMILSLFKKMVKATLLRLLSSEFEYFFT